MTEIANITAPIATVSETNQREHWRSRSQRRKTQRRDAYYSLCQVPEYRAGWPVRVRLTRLNPTARNLDDDNLRGALKAVRDGVADWLGLDDGDARISWEYDQRRGEKGEKAVQIQIWENQGGREEGI